MSDLATAAQVAIVTGAGSGIGAAIARDLGAPGTKLVLVGRRGRLLDERVAEIEAEGGTALAAVGDVREFADLERTANVALERWGRIDILVANAAMASPKLEKSRAYGRRSLVWPDRARSPQVAYARIDSFERRGWPGNRRNPVRVRP